MASQQPQTVMQAVIWLESTLEPEVLDTLRNTPAEDLILLHFGLGAQIRQRLDLWTGNRNLLRELGHLHPDDVAMAIIERLWNHLNGRED